MQRLDPVGSQFHLPPGQHLEAQVQVGEPAAHPGLIAHHYPQFVGAPETPDGGVDGPVKIEDVGFGHLDSFFKPQLPQGVHDGGQIDLHGTLHRAGLAARADPDGMRLQGLPAQAQLQQPQDGVGRVVHGRHKRAAVGAGAAVQTAVELDPAQFLQLPVETGVWFIEDDAGLHSAGGLDA